MLFQNHVLKQHNIQSKKKKTLISDQIFKARLHRLTFLQMCCYVFTAPFEPAPNANCYKMKVLAQDFIFLFSSFVKRGIK